MLKNKRRNKIKQSVLLSTILIFVVSFTIHGQTNEESWVKRAALNYIEAVYQMNPAKIEESVHPDLVKRGFFIKPGEKNYSSSSMTFAELVELSKKYNKNGQIPKDAPQEVLVFDISDQTASAKVTAIWGIDYLHLAKYDGKWKIINILWQTPPKKMNNNANNRK